eukprot:1415166-Pleurochrysis_carterae.AAC.1
MLQRTSEQLLKPRQGRAVPPQGGYFHGTSEAATLSICKEGFDNALWKARAHLHTPMLCRTTGRFPTKPTAQGHLPFASDQCPVNLRSTQLKYYTSERDVCRFSRLAHTPRPVLPRVFAQGGNYGRGQYLSASASKAVSGKYTHGDCMLLLCEAVLGN